MIGGLVRKELRQLVPLIVGLGALQLWGVLDEFILKSPDTYLNPVAPDPVVNA